MIYKIVTTGAQIAVLLLNLPQRRLSLAARSGIWRVFSFEQ